jgi:3-oxoacyl-[acyl-carrier protein] reductase
MARSVLVTGGGRGIGLAVARALAADGDAVAVTYRTGEPPEGLLGVRCDIDDAEAVERAFTEVEAAHGPVEVLVANAGVTRDMLLMQMTDADFEDVVQTNLIGAFRVVRRACPAMLRTRRGRIVFVSSLSGLSGSPGQTNYAASKAALVGLARSMVREFGARGVTVNVVASGLVDTAMAAALSEARRKEIVDAVPLGRLAQPEELAAVVRFLASAEAGYITGGVIPVDGGLGMGH